MLRALQRHRLFRQPVSRYLVGAFAIASSLALGLACDSEDPRAQEIILDVKSSPIEQTDTTWEERLSALCGSATQDWSASRIRAVEWRITVSCPGVLTLVLQYDESLDAVTLIDE